MWLLQSSKTSKTMTFLTFLTDLKPGLNPLQQNYASSLPLHLTI
jgi:hypothetical protein